MGRERFAYNRSMTMAAIALLVGVVAPDSLRVDVLSLLVPQQVEIVCAHRTLELPNGGRLAPGSRLVLVRDGRDVIASAPGGWRWRGSGLAVGAPGERLSVDVRGRDSRTRVLPGPVEVGSDGVRLRVVATYDLEAFVASAVAAELDQVVEPATLEAAAVTIRSYAVARPARHEGEGVDVCDTTHCVHSRGLVEDATPAAGAARATRGLVLTSGGRVVPGYCTACCGGRTATPSLLWGVEDTGQHESIVCTACSASRYYRWRRVVRTDAVVSAVEGLVGGRLGSDVDLREVAGPGAWVLAVVVRGGGRERRVGGDAFRMAVDRRLGWDSIPSPRFTIERRSGSLVIRGGGHGHGIGLCVAGAVARARRGASRDAILTAYFPRARLQLLGAGPSVYSCLF